MENKKAQFHFRVYLKKDEEDITIREGIETFYSQLEKGNCYPYFFQEAFSKWLKDLGLEEITEIFNINIEGEYEVVGIAEIEEEIIKTINLDDHIEGFKIMSFEAHKEDSTIEQIEDLLDEFLKE